MRHEVMCMNEAELTLRDHTMYDYYSNQSEYRKKLLPLQRTRV